MEKKERKKLSPESLAKLAEARKKALEVKHKLSTVRRAEMQEQRTAEKKQLDDKYNEIVGKTEVEQPKEVMKEPEEEVKAEKQTKPKGKKKKIVKVIEISDSDSDSGEEGDDEQESESDDEPVKYVVKKKTKAKPVKPKARAKKLDEYEPHELTPIIARGMLKDKVMGDAKRMAWQSLFPTHDYNGF
jgi:hypothetical protein